MTAPRGTLPTEFGVTPTGDTVTQIDLTTEQLAVSVLTLGARLSSVNLSGTEHELTLGADSVAPLFGPLAYAGPIVGPVANRIGGAEFEIDGQTFHTDSNENIETTVHSGGTGIHSLVWDVTKQTGSKVTLRLDLPDRLGGFPGNRVIRAHWQLHAPATLDLILTATTDAATPINLAHHPYWCLDPVAGDSLRVLAECYLPTNAQTLPTGEITHVDGTAFDLRQFRDLADPHLPPLDTNYCVGPARGLRRRVATLSGANGVRLDVETTEPGLQVFNGFDQSAAGSDRPGLIVALEPQGWPDAMNHASFPSIILQPDQTYRQHTRYVFSRNQ